MACLVIAELEEGKLNRPSLATISAAKMISNKIDVLIFDSNAKDNVAKVVMVRKVIFTSNDEEDLIAENIVPLIIDLSKEYEHILAPSGTFSKNLLPRVAALLDVQQLSDIINVIDVDTYERSIYAGNAIAKVKSLDKKKIITVRTTAFLPVEEKGGSAALEESKGIIKSTKVSFVRRTLSQSERPELLSAKIVVSGGRGVGSSDSFNIIEGLADKLGAAVGASRAAVDAGYISNDHQVGQTGKVIAPELYIAIGISGAIQHLAGMKDSKIIVAINKDEDAPIFQIADYGLVGDLFSLVPEFTSIL